VRAGRELEEEVALLVAGGADAEAERDHLGAADAGVERPA